MTFAQALELATIKLNANKIINPHLEAELLLSAITKKNREFILIHLEKKLTKLQIANYELQITKRCKNIPLAYLTGHKEFYGFDFVVNQDVLIPRPETELMVELALECATHGQLTAPANKQNLIFIDVGTGSGCIIISLAKTLSCELRVASCEFVGIDMSKKALAIAMKNAKLNRVNKKINFKQGNLLEPILKNNTLIKKLVFGHWSLVILCNLPYLTPDQIKKSPSIKYEPRLALSAGSDGLKYYRRLLAQIKKLSEKNINAKLNIFCEIDPNQKEKFIKSTKKILSQANCQIINDLSGKNRFVKITT